MSQNTLLFRFFKIGYSICFPLLLGSSHVLFAQTDTLNFPPVEIQAARADVFSFSKTIHLDSLEKAKDTHLAAVLTEKSGIFFKTYGQGSLASPSSRGAGFGHTAVIWNGFNLQHPMLGGLDFSLLTSSFFDQIEIQQNGLSALHGSGTIGGGVHLNNQAIFNEGLHAAVHIGTGSFGEQKTSSKIRFSTKNLALDLVAFAKKMDNNFTFIDNRGGQATQEHAALQTAGITQNTAFKIGKRHLLQSHIWVNKTEREIPPTETAANQHAIQLDDSYRTGLEWIRTGDTHALKARIAYLQERIFFDNDVIDISDSRTHNWIAEIESNWFISSKWQWNAGLHQTFSSADASVFLDTKRRQELAAFSSLKYRPWKDKTTLIGSVRQAAVADKVLPLVWSFSASQQINSLFQFQFLVSKNYNLPTFNDLYWPGLGNPDLQAESGVNMDIRWFFAKKTKHSSIQLNLTAYQNIIDDWILWAPNDNGLWTPSNQRKVRTRGIEFLAEYERKIAAFSFRWNGIYTFTDAKVKAIYAGLETSLGKQLIFVPLHQFKNSIRCSYQKISLQYQHAFYSKLFTSFDNKEELAAYQLGNLQVAYAHPILKKDWLVYFKINNLWNVDYETVPFRPMPLRHFQAGAQLRF